ncbi:diguanylate cyclase/phosphodiesterase with PAS/PAC sensor [Pseudanabaena sp. lw0831]|uniref:two-component system response regulator n=1 Tax=Pseudanabaena sp. lw0831 TaxID=1357935 RepID=UPI00191659B6|nr:EAL domain-containing response regulator [Pseudanabaena sp. lw0831]GBO52832.1 diguanylate cyclase/phosphodiesterase with PAS/PAC sensor [Pseudanabaena sp. lw0831]
MNTEFLSKSKILGKILIVDDNPNNLKVLSGTLANCDWEVLVAVDGESAIEQAIYVKPDLIFLDVMMPIMDGFSACKILKSTPETSEIPIIFMTSLSDTLDKVKGFDLGAVDYITKPFDRDEVIARVKTHLQVSSLTRQVQEKNLQLQNFTQELENRVNERTSELSDALCDLQKVQAQLLLREQRLAYEAFHDTLTGLPNRAWLMQRLQYLTTQKQLYAVLFTDLDRFKVINDSLGHLVGDELLKQATRRLRASLPARATVARFGGDEFVILFEDIANLEEATDLADRIQAELETPFKLYDYELFVSISIGITIGTEDYQQPEDILRDADIAMYQAKHKGRGRYDVFNPSTRDIAIARLDLENDLRRAIEREEFCMYYQPIFCLTSNRIRGFESLVRWNHPSGKLISPSKFIGIAEEIGLINALGWWVLRESLRQMQTWYRQFLDQTSDRTDNFLWVNVNISPIQLKQINFAQNVKIMLDELNLPSNCLKLEITESCLLDSSNIESITLEQLKNLDIKLCIDDFGTGYSSLSRLHELPIHTLKIDRAFVKELALNSNNNIVTTIINLAHGLNMDVVAEGIETEEQKQILRSLSCDYAQGYLFSPPLDTESANLLLENTLLASKR